MSDDALPPSSADAGVLICDDNDAIRTLLGVIVNGRDGIHVVGEASDGNEAVAQAQALQPAVILLDLNMPGRSGLDAMEELRKVAPTARIIVFSGFSRAIVAEEVIALGATAYLEKGSPPQAILDAIESALAGAPA